MISIDFAGGSFALHRVSAIEPVALLTPRPSTRDRGFILRVWSEGRAPEVDYRALAHDGAAFTIVIFGDARRLMLQACRVELVTREDRFDVVVCSYAGAVNL